MDTNSSKSIKRSNFITIGLVNEAVKEKKYKFDDNLMTSPETIISKALEKFPSFNVESFNDQNKKDLIETFKLIRKYLDVFTKKLYEASDKSILSKIESNLEKLLIALNKMKNSNPIMFKRSIFKDTLQTFTEKIQTTEAISVAIVLHFDLIVELQRLSSSPLTSSSTAIMNEAERVKRIQKIRKYEKAFKIIVNQIRKAENKPLSLDDLENHNEYTKIPILYKNAVKIWKEIENLSFRSTRTGRCWLHKFTYDGTTNPKVNALIETIYKNHLMSLDRDEERIVNHHQSKSSRNKSNKSKQNFTYLSVLDLQNELSVRIAKENIDFDLSDTVLEKIYKDLMFDLQQYRTKMFNESLTSIELLEHLRENSNVDLNDSELNERLSANENSFFLCTIE
ncbi:FK506-binding protein 8 [Sarcoptes scabiei]|nr:FK506-binding protein 8 [Sarcoptes scabiei]